MSLEKDIAMLNPSKEFLKEFKRLQKAQVTRLKFQKRLLEKMIISRVRKGRHNGKWDSKASLAEVQSLQQQRSNLNKRIFRLGGSKTANPEFDSDP